MAILDILHFPDPRLRNKAKPVTEVDDESIAGNEDITRAGMIGNYVHGNEPSHHVPYLPCFTGSPWNGP